MRPLRLVRQSSGAVAAGGEAGRTTIHSRSGLGPAGHQPTGGPVAPPSGALGIASRRSRPPASRRGEEGPHRERRQRRRTPTHRKPAGAGLPRDPLLPRRHRARSSTRSERAGSDRPSQTLAPAGTILAGHRPRTADATGLAGETFRRCWRPDGRGGAAGTVFCSVGPPDSMGSRPNEPSVAALSLSLVCGTNRQPHGPQPCARCAPTLALCDVDHTRAAVQLGDRARDPRCCPTERPGGACSSATVP